MGLLALCTVCARRVYRWDYGEKDDEEEQEQSEQLTGEVEEDVTSELRSSQSNLFIYI